MTREHAKRVLPIIQAWSEGKTVQFRYPSHEWHDVPMGTNPFVDTGEEWEWRIKPKLREFWVCWNEQKRLWDVTASEILAMRYAVKYHVREIEEVIVKPQQCSPSSAS